MHRLTLLGAFRIDAPDGPVGGSASRGRHAALLALLARSGGKGMQRETITALLWPEAEAERARHSLEQAIYVLRRALGQDIIVALGPALSLNPKRVTTDVEEMLAAIEAREWEAAVSCYGGPFLEAFHLSGAPDFERWLDAERSELHHRQVAALREAAESQTAAGDHAGAAGIWRRLAAADRLSAPAVLGLMRALAAAGHRSAAIAAARVHETLLRQELDAAVDPEVVALADQLRREPAGPAWAEAVPAAPAIAAPAGRRRRIVGAVAAGVVVLGALAFALGRAARGSEPGSVPAAPATLEASAGRRERVSVAEFTTDPADSVPEAVGRMAADWIRQGLARTGLVAVASAAAAPSPADNAGVQIAGRVYRVGSDLWFQAWISRPATGALVSTMDPVHAPLTDPVAALEPLRQQVLGAVGTLFDPRLSDWSGAALRPPTFEAYRAFVHGLESFSSSELPTALGHFRRAAALDSAYAQPHLWGAWSCVRMYRPACADSMVRAVAPLVESLTPLEQAWRDRILAVLRGDGEASYRAARRMVELSPGSGWAMALHNAAMDTRRAQLAVATLRTIGPEGLGLVGAYYWGAVAEAHHALGEYREALALLDEGIATGNRRPETLTALVATLAALGDTARISAVITEAAANPGLSESDRAEIAFVSGVELRAHGNPGAAAPLLEAAADRYQSALARRPDGRTLAGLLSALLEAERWADLQRFADTTPLDEVDRIGILGHAAARRGDNTLAARASARLAALDHAFLLGANDLWRARIAAEQGDADRAITLLRQAFAGGSERQWRFLHYARDFDGLRDDPGFQDLVRPRE